MSRLRQKGRQVQFNVWPIIKRVKQTDNLLKTVWWAFLEHFAANTRLFQVKTLIYKDSVTFADEVLFILVDSDRSVCQY